MYYNAVMIKDAKDKPIKILYFDTETVTLESPELSCTFFQLSGMIEIDGVEVERFDFYMNPDHSCMYDPESLAFNGITEEDLEKHPHHTKVYPEFLAILEKYIDKFDKNDKLHVIGFNNLKFDNDKLWNWFALIDHLKEQEIERKYNEQVTLYAQTGLPEDKPGRKEKVYCTYGSYMWTSPSIDCYPLIGLVFIKYRNLFPNFKLQTVAKKLAEMGLIDKRFNDDENWHNALFDIEATRELFHFALRMFRFNLFEKTSPEE